MKNLKLTTCMKIFEKYDREMYKYIVRREEKELNMSEVSAYARTLRDEHK